MKCTKCTICLKSKKEVRIVSGHPVCKECIAAELHERKAIAKIAIEKLNKKYNTDEFSEVF